MAVIYTRLPDGKIGILTDTLNNNHPNIFGGNIGVTAAGEIVIDKGIITRLTNCSGNYQFDGTEIESLVKQLKEMGFIFSENAIKLY